MYKDLYFIIFLAIRLSCILRKTIKINLLIKTNPHKIGGFVFVGLVGLEPTTP